jgi:hypothetical protein
MTEVEIKGFIEKYRAIYKTFSPVYSPALGAKVNFNSEGFNHLTFKSGKKRTDNIVINRLPILLLAAPVIKNCPKTIETRTRKENIKGKPTKTTYYALEANVGKSSTRVRVVVRRIGVGGAYNFFSIMKYN